MRIRRTKTNSTDPARLDPAESAGLEAEEATPSTEDVQADFADDDETVLDTETGSMTVSVTMPVAAGPVFTEQQEPWDPGKVERSKTARYVRVLTGVAEPLLDRIPTERARYTALACVMLCTATVSGISMFFALSEILGAASAWFLPFALFWAGFILSVDRWLVSSSPSKHSFIKLQTLLLRLAVAVVLGFIIAEPVLLRVFQTAVVNQVQQDRRATTNHGVAMYKACNPMPGQPVAAGVDCTAWTLSTNGTAPAADQAQINALNTDITNLQNSLNSENATLQGLANTVNQECNGSSGPGLTGQSGNGPACQQDEQHYRDFKNSQPFAQQQAQLTNDQSQLTALQGSARNDTTAMGGTITRQIDAWVAKQPTDATPIGLIERFKALVELSDNSVVVDFGAWLLRLFFVLIDCLPVLVKFIGGATPYDELARRQINIAQDVLQVEGRTRIDVAEIHRAVQLKREHAQAAMQEQTFNADVRDHAVSIEAKQWEAVDRDYELQLIRMGLTPDRKDPDRDDEPREPLATAPAATATAAAQRPITIPVAVPVPGPRKANGHPTAKTPGF